MKITKVFADRVKLRWEPPRADGGSEITNYIIEKRETSRANWALVTSNIHGHITDCSVEKLIEGHEYQFRVSAENQYGVGDPIMTDPVMVKNPYGEFRGENNSCSVLVLAGYHLSLLPNILMVAFTIWPGRVPSALFLILQRMLYLDERS